MGRAAYRATNGGPQKGAGLQVLEPCAPRTGTKQAMLLGLLSRNTGASIVEIVEATGWRSNTVHSALATLRKSGRQILVEQTASARFYRLVVEQSKTG